MARGSDGEMGAELALWIACAAVIFALAFVLSWIEKREKGRWPWQR
jgi:hypothetical protein